MRSPRVERFLNVIRIIDGDAFTRCDCRRAAGRRAFFRGADAKRVSQTRQEDPIETVWKKTPLSITPGYSRWRTTAGRRTAEGGGETREKARPQVRSCCGGDANFYCVASMWPRGWRKGRCDPESETVRLRIRVASRKISRARRANEKRVRKTVVKRVRGERSKNIVYRPAREIA